MEKKEQQSSLSMIGAQTIVMAAMGAVFGLLSKKRGAGLSKTIASWAAFGAIFETTNGIFGLHKAQNQGSVLRNAASGAIGAAAGVAASEAIQTGARPSTRLMAWAAGIGGLIQAAVALFTKKPDQHQPSESPPPPPSFEPQHPNGLELANVPPILDLLVAKGELTTEQQTHVLDQIKQGRTGFAADIAVADGFITKAQAEQALSEQLRRKALAITADFAVIKSLGAMPTPAWLKPNWGNNGVNPVAEQPTRTDGASAAINIAQNLLLLVNENPALAQTADVEEGIRAALRLAGGISQGDSKLLPIAKMGSAWHATMNHALEFAAPKPLTDTNGKHIALNDFIAARDTEINAAITEVLRQPPQKNTGHQR